MFFTNHFACFWAFQWTFHPYGLKGANISRREKILWMGKAVEWDWGLKALGGVQSDRKGVSKWCARFWRVRRFSIQWVGQREPMWWDWVCNRFEREKDGAFPAAGNVFDFGKFWISFVSNVLISFCFNQVFKMLCRWRVQGVGSALVVRLLVPGAGLSFGQLAIGRRRICYIQQ